MDIKTLRRTHLEKYVKQFRTAEEFLKPLNDRLQRLNESPISSGYLSQLRVGPPKGRNIGDVVARKLELGLGLEKTALDHPLSAEHKIPKAGSRPKYTLLPVISSIQAGAWGDINNPFELGGADSYSAVTGTWSQQAFLLTIEGDSMTDSRGGLSIPHGAQVVVEPEEEAKNGDIVVAKLERHEQATVKKLVVDPPNTYLMPLNPQYDKITIDEECRIVGVVKQVVIVIRG